MFKHESGIQWIDAKNNFLQVDRTHRKFNKIILELGTVN